MGFPKSYGHAIGSRAVAKCESYHIITIMEPPNCPTMASALKLHTLRVQVPNNHVLTQNLYYNSYYPKPKYLIIGYLDPLG